MAGQKKTKQPKANMDAYIEGAGTVVQQPIVETLEKNYMPYAMSVIVSRAFPEIDGFKPSHRKLLYTMYKMGLLTGGRTKSANVVGQTMRLNPHGDQAIYETMVRLSRGNETLLHPYVDSKGSFGKAYSRDMAYAASRYTEVKLEAICAELFRDIDKNTVDFVPNYDNTMQEPTLLPSTFPTILVNANVGIGVSMASAVCPFNLTELCETTIALMRNPDHNLHDTLKAPDFPGGGYIVYDYDEIDKVFKTGRGSIKVRCKWHYNKPSNCIEITEIPSTTSIEAIIEKIATLIKLGKIREIKYVRDETDLEGLTIGIDLKQGTDPEKLMQKLYKLTPLQDNYSCNFNILVHGYPKVMGVREILSEWIDFRMDCVRRRVDFELAKKQEKLHLLKGLEKILADIDKAIKIIRETVSEQEVIPNLMIGFAIDEIQADYVAEIKLRNLNEEYILNRTKDIESLSKDIGELNETLGSDKKIKNIIIGELKEVIKKYGQPRKSEILYDVVEQAEDFVDETPDFACHLFLSKEGYFKKITPQSLRMSGEQKLKDGDSISQQFDVTNKTELLFFTDKCNVYKTKALNFSETRASAMGSFIPAELGFEQDENILKLVCTKDYKGYLIYIFKNGKVAKVPLNVFETKTNRKKMTKAYTDKQEIIEIFFVEENADIMLTSSGGRAILFNTALVAPKQTRDTIGVCVMKLKAKAEISNAYIVDEPQNEKYIVKSIPAMGCFLDDADDPEQIKMF